MNTLPDLKRLLKELDKLVQESAFSMENSQYDYLLSLIENTKAFFIKLYENPDSLHAFFQEHPVLKESLERIIDQFNKNKLRLNEIHQVTQSKLYKLQQYKKALIKFNS